MTNNELCERCDGSGADPMQSYVDDVIALCVECRGDGVVAVFDERELERIAA